MKYPIIYGRPMGFGLDCEVPENYEDLIKKINCDFKGAVEGLAKKIYQGFELNKRKGEISFHWRDDVGLLEISFGHGGKGAFFSQDQRKYVFKKY